MLISTWPELETSGNRFSHCSCGNDSKSTTAIFPPERSSRYLILHSISANLPDLAIAFLKLSEVDSITALSLPKSVSSRVQLLLPHCAIRVRVASCMSRQQSLECRSTPQTISRENHTPSGAESVLRHNITRTLRTRAAFPAAFSEQIRPTTTQRNSVSKPRNRIRARPVYGTDKSGKSR